MRFLLDHDVPADVGRVLSQVGHQLTLVRDAPGASSSDREVFGYAAANGLVRISCNRDDFLRLAANDDRTEGSTNFA